MLDRLQDERGFALAFALLVCVVLTISTVSIVTYTSASSRNASVSSSKASAYDVAEAGLNAAVSMIKNAANASLPTLLGCTADGADSTDPCTDLAVDQDGGTASFHGLFTSGDPTGHWTITSVGAVTNPTGAADLKKSVTATVDVTPGGTINNVSIWNYIVSTAPPGDGCQVNITGTLMEIDVPLFVTGNLCLSGTQAQIVEDTSDGGQPVDVQVMGTLTMSGKKASVGADASDPITSGYVAGGCRTSTSGSFHTCTSADRWYVRSTDDPTAATAPTTDFPGWYQNASPGPNHPCDTALTNAAYPGYPVLASSVFSDGGGTMDGTNATFNMTPTNSNYACVTSSGTLAWNHSTHLLTVNGTIFFDGEVQLLDGAAFYHGKAAVYVNGELSFNNNGSAAGLRAGCPSSPSTPTGQCPMNSSGGWDPNKDMVVFAVNKPTGTAVDLTPTHSEFQGDILCTETSTAALAGTQTKVEGGIICGNFTWGTQTFLYPLPQIQAQNMPNGAPNWPAQIGSPVITGSS